MKKTTFRVIQFIFLFNIPLFAQWVPDMRLTNDPGTSFTSSNNTPTIAATGTNVHTVWWDNRNTDWEIYYKRSVDGGLNWSEDTRLTNSVGNSYVPTIAVFNSTVHVVWQDQRDGNREIYYKRSTDSGNTWSVDTRLTYDTSSSQYPAIAVMGQTVHIAWYDKRDGNEEEYYKRSTDGGLTWSADTRLTNNTYIQEQPSISVSGQNVYVVWQDPSSGPNKVGFKRSTNGGANWLPDTLLTNRFGGTYSPCISASGQNLTIVWEDHNTFWSEIYCILSSNGGLSWSSEIQLSNNNSFSGYTYVYVDGQNIHVTWWDTNYVAPGWSDIFYKFSTDNGVSWSTDLNLSNNPGSSEVGTIAVSGSVVHVIWCDRRDGNWEIYYKRNPNGNMVGISNITNNTPNEFSLSQNYPNPFNPTTKIRFSVPKQAEITINLSDITGRIISSIVQPKQFAAGVYEADFDGSNLATGIYFYSLYADGLKIDTKKMVLVK